MTLVVWNQTLTQGIGRSGTRYCVSRVGKEGADAGWAVAVDDERLYLTEDAIAAVVRAEHLESLRCVLLGFTNEMTDGELDRAVVVADEMSLSALRAIGRMQLTDAERREVENGLDRLRQAQDEISLIRRRRGRPVAAGLQH